MASLSTWVRENRIAASAVVFAGYTAVMMRLEGRMRAAGGPGVIPFAVIAVALGYSFYPARPTGRTGH